MCEMRVTPEGRKRKTPTVGSHPSETIRRSSLPRCETAETPTGETARDAPQAGKVIKERPIDVRDARDAKGRKAQDANGRVVSARGDKEQFTKVRDGRDTNRRDGTRRTTGRQVIKERPIDVRDARNAKGRKAQDANCRVASA
jgi:hypothetical protein